MTKQEKTSKLEQQRAEKLAQIKQMGIDPYGQRFDDSESAAAIKDRFEDDNQEQTAKTPAE